VRVTEDDYLATMTGEKPALEFINGEVYAKPLVKRSHLLIVDEVLAALREYRRRVGGLSGPEGTVDLSRGGDRRYRVPDAAYWAPDRQGSDPVFGPPTVAVEVRSQGQTIQELRAKCREYRERGVEVCWLIDPDARVVEAFDGERDAALIATAGALESPALPGFRLTLEILWQALDA
jgi:Uma2 family endonuclease